jgi:hypothetical protein
MKPRKLSPISSAMAEHIFSQEVLGRHMAEYYFDRDAGFIFAADPFWIDEAYSRAITVTDTGILSRNLRNVRLCSSLFGALASPDGPTRGIELGGGYGIFVRGMRDAGFDFYWHDKYAENLMARGFEAIEGPYEFAVAFEVLEHTVNPRQFLLESRERFGFRILVFSATCFDPSAIPGKDWWYWAFETGQHLSFFSRDTLDRLGSEMGMKLMHLTADKFMYYDEGLKVAGTARRVAMFDVLGRVMSGATHRAIHRKRMSLTWADHLLLRDKLRTEAGR